MFEELERLSRIYPNSKFCKIPKYDADFWKDKTYDSSLDNKATITRWKSSPLNIKEALAAAEEGFRVAWIVPKGFVVVDIDNEDNEKSQEYLEKLLQKFEVKYSYNYTSRGVHLVFSDPSEKIKTNAAIKCGLNISIDTRANDSGYIILPTNDPNRRWGKWNDYVEEIPYFLKPLFKSNTPSFIGMQDGDGRNSALYAWRMSLEKSSGLTEDQIEKTVRIINENIFDTPMENKELFKTVLRKMDTKDASAEKENKYSIIADTIIGKYDIVTYNNAFYRYNGIYYKKMDRADLEKIIHYDVSQNIGKSGREEIIDFVKIKTRVEPSEVDKEWNKIACENGIINLVTGELEESTKSNLNTIYIPWKYNPDPEYSPRIDEFFKAVCNGDVKKMEFLYQVAGYCLLKKNLFERFVICKGEGGTGKSTYLNLITTLVGENNASHIGINDFDKDYHLASTMGKLVNLDDDAVDGKVLEQTGRFKSIVSGNLISVRQIYMPVVEYMPFVTCIFCCNKMPRIMDKTSGLYRRMLLVELNHKVENPDPLFMNKVTKEDMEYFLFKCVEGIKEAIALGHFCINQSEAALLTAFQRRQSPLNEWLYEQGATLKDVIGVRVNDIYPQFISWCEINGYKNTMNCYTFKEDICALFKCDVKIEKGENGVPYQKFYTDEEYDPNYRPF